MAHELVAGRPPLDDLLRRLASQVGTSVGTAVVGTLVAALVTVTLPAGVWSSELVASFFHGERVTFAALAVVVGVVAGWGASTLSDSRVVDA